MPEKGGSLIPCRCEFGSFFLRVSSFSVWTSEPLCNYLISFYLSYPFPVSEKQCLSSTWWIQASSLACFLAFFRSFTSRFVQREKITSYPWVQSWKHLIVPGCRLGAFPYTLSCSAFLFVGKSRKINVHCSKYKSSSFPIKNTVFNMGY